MLPSTPTQHCLVRDSEVSAMKGVTDENDVAMIATDNFSQPSVSWRDKMLSKRKKVKLTNKIHRIKTNASFELAVAEAQLVDFVSDDMTFEPPSPIDWSMEELPEILQPTGWSKSFNPDSVLQLSAIAATMDSVIETSVVAVEKKDCRTSEELEDECELFKIDAV